MVNVTGSAALACVDSSSVAVSSAVVNLNIVVDLLQDNDIGQSQSTPAPSTIILSECVVWRNGLVDGRDSDFGFAGLGQIFQFKVAWFVAYWLQHGNDIEILHLVLRLDLPSFIWAMLRSKRLPVI